MIITKQSNGITWYNCQGQRWFLIHDNSKVIKKGQVFGQGGSRDIVEHFDTETEMEERLVQLGLTEDD